MAKQLEWTTIQRKPNDLVPLEINPRKITEAKRKKLIESLEKFNLAEIPAINKDNTVIAGNQRLKALQLMGRGDELIDVRMPNRKLTQKELKEYALIANTHAGEWDMDIFEEFFQDVNLEDMGLSMDDFKMPKMGDLVDDTEPEVLEAQEDDFEVPEENQIQTDIVVGDLIEIGEHRLLCGDSTDSDAVAKLMNGEKADMVFTDPPYELDYNYSNTLLFAENAHVFVFNNDRALIRQLKDSPLKFKKFFVFNHSGTAIPQEGGNEVFLDYILISHEIIGNPKVRYNKGDGTRTVIKGEYRRAIEHKHEKPVTILAPIIKGYTDENFIILDFYAGGGKLFSVCSQLNRKCYGIEINPKYCQVIINRMLKLDPTLTIKRNGELWNTTASS